MPVFTDLVHKTSQTFRNMMYPSSDTDIRIPSSGNNSGNIPTHDAPSEVINIPKPGKGKKSKKSNGQQAQAIPVAPSEVIPDNILAFRTITTFLQRIQQRRPFKLLEDEQILSDSERRELRLITAFSTVAVIEHEVVAAVANRRPGKLEVIACTSLSNDENQQVITQSQAPTLFRFLFTKNPRTDDLKKQEKIRVPVISDTDCPPGLEPGDEGLKQYLEKRW